MFHNDREIKQLGPRLGVSLWLLAAVFFTVLSFVILHVSNTWNLFTIYATLSWSFGLPIIMMSFIGALRSRSFRMSDFKGRIPNLVIFEIPTIANEDVIPALSRVVDSIIKFAPRNLDNWRIDLVTEEWSEARDAIAEKYGSLPNFNLIVVPMEYQTESRSLNKSRALQYATE